MKKILMVLSGVVVACGAEKRAFEGVPAAGEELVYRFSLDVEGKTADAELGFGLSAAGELSVAVLPGEQRRVCVKRVSRARLTAMGRDAAAPALEGACAVARLGISGAVDGIAYAPSADGTARAALEALALEVLPVVDPRAEVVDREQPGASGSGPVHLERVERLAWVRTRERYTRPRGLGVAVPGAGGDQRLRHAYRLETNADGTLLGIEGAEELSLPDGRRTVRLEARLARWEHDGAPERPAAPLAFHAPGDLGASDAELAAMNVQRARGLTAADMKAYVQQVALEGPAPDHGRQFSRAIGLLRLDPAAASELEAVFGAVPARGRTYVLDLLANAGTAEAEAVLRSVLAREVETAPRELLADEVARLGFVHRPSDALGEQAAAMLARLGTADPPDRLGENLSLAVGSLARELALNGRPAGDMLVARLLARLEHARSPEGTSLALRALGNTRDARGSEAALPYAADASPVVRYGAVLAQRHARSEAARAAIERALLDPVRGVQQAALIALADQPWRASAAPLLAASIARIDPYNLAAAWALIREHAPREAAQAAARHILATPGAFPYLEASLRRWLAAP